MAHARVRRRHGGAVDRVMPATSLYAPPHAGTGNRVFAVRGGPGFTLIEVLMVLLILGVLLGLVLGLHRHARESAMRAQARAELGELHSVLAAYFGRFDAYPNPGVAAPVALETVLNAVPAWVSTDAPDAEPAPGQTLRDFLPADAALVDPWGRPYLYRHDAQSAPLFYQLYSLGANTNQPHERILFQP